MYVSFQYSLNLSTLLLCHHLRIKKLIKIVLYEKADVKRLLLAVWWKRFAYRQRHVQSRIPRLASTIRASRSVLRDIFSNKIVQSVLFPPFFCMDDVFPSLLLSWAKQFLPRSLSKFIACRIVSLGKGMQYTNLHFLSVFDFDGKYLECSRDLHSQMITV